MTNMGAFALYAREVKRFQKIWFDTLLNPIVSIGLYLAIFGVIVGERSAGGVSFLAFVYAGLLAMNMVMTSFNNPAFALIIGKNVGTIVDLQLAPIKPWAVSVAMAAAGLTRGLVTVSMALLLTVWFVPDFGLAHPFILIAILLLTGLQFGMVGVLFGMWAKGFEALTFATTFVLQPMIMLSGVFYPISALPGVWAQVAAFNPLHHNVNLIRYAFLGVADTSIGISVAVILGALAVLLPVTHVVVKKKLVG